MNDTSRLVQFLILTASFFVFMASLYFEWVKHLAPCSLCIMQRVCVFLVLVCSGIGLFFKRGGNGIILFEGIIAIAGLYFAFRQIWLQSLPADQMAACLPGLDILIRYFPWQDILHALFFGAADCGESGWQWLGLSMPAWAALYFFCLLAAALFLRFFSSKPSLP